MNHKFCSVCQKDTHDTKDCWGSGTVVVTQSNYKPLPLGYWSSLRPSPMSMDDFVAKYFPSAGNNDIRFS